MGMFSVGFVCLLSVCPVQALTFNALTYKLHFGTRLHLHNIYVKVEYQGYWVKVKVIQAQLNIPRG